MMRYLKLLATFFRMSVIADLEYRANIIGKVGTDICWYLTNIALFEVMFLHVPTLGGWSIEDARIFLGALFLADAIHMVFFAEGLDRFSALVVSGGLDLLLCKPVNSQFMVSCHRIAWSYLVNVMLAGSWLFWSLSHRLGEVSPLLLGKVLLVASAGGLIMYTLRFSFATFSLIFTQADNLQYLWYNLFRLSTRPHSIYPSGVQLLLLTILPLAFIASIPAEILLGERGTDGIITLLGIAMGCLLFSRWLWGRCLRHYASASS
jgi:ABC-2 type transport system permease protein